MRESDGDYNAVGVPIGNGDRAYGKHQILGSNIPNWSKEALGKALSIDEFLADPKKQELIAQFKIHELLKKYSEKDVISIWFTGQTLAGNEYKQDANGTKAIDYVNQVLALKR